MRTLKKHRPHVSSTLPRKRVYVQRTNFILSRGVCFSRLAKWPPPPPSILCVLSGAKLVALEYSWHIHTSSTRTGGLEIFSISRSLFICIPFVRRCCEHYFPNSPPLFTILLCFIPRIYPTYFRPLSTSTACIILLLVPPPQQRRGTDPLGKSRDLYTQPLYPSPPCLYILYLATTAAKAVLSSFHRRYHQPTRRNIVR